MHISDVVWASGLTAVALLVQTWLTNRRDERRQAREVEERARVAAEARSQAIQDHWRDQRLEAHAEFLAVINETLDLIADSVIAVIAGDRSIDPVDAEVRAAVVRAVSRVRLLGSEASRDAANTAHGAMIQGWHQMTRARYKSDDTDPSAGLIRAGDELKAASLAYTSAVRRDLGTDT